MSREDGFAIADIDTGFMADPKVVAMVRRLKDPEKAMVYTGLYMSLVYASWAAGDRITFEEGLPAWWLEPADDARTELQLVGLIDEEGRIPFHAWEGWFRPAWDRREKRRESGAAGGRRSWGKRRLSIASASLNPSVPSVPTDRPSRARAREENGSTNQRRDGESFIDSHYRLKESS